MSEVNGRQHVFCAKDRYTEHSLPPYASVAEGMAGWLGAMGQCLYRPGMPLICSSHFPQQLLTPVSHLLRPQHRISSATKLICSFRAPNGCARKSSWHRGPRCMLSTSASAVPHLPGPKSLARHLTGKTHPARVPGTPYEQENGISHYNRLSPQHVGGSTFWKHLLSSYPGGYTDR